MANSIISYFKRLIAEGRNKLTVMIIPHSEHGIKNIHIPQFTIFLLLLIMGIGLAVSTVYLAKHAAISKELTRLGKYKNINSDNLLIYSNEIHRFNSAMSGFQDAMSNFGKFHKKKKENMYGIGGNELDLSELDDYVKDISAAGEREAPSVENEILTENSEHLRNSMTAARNINQFIQKRRQFVFAMPTLWPLKGGIGHAYHKNGSSKEIHISTVAGVPVISTGKGQVSDIRRTQKDMFTVYIDHGFGFFSEYSGLMNVKVSEKDKVEKGDVIAASSTRLTYRVRVANRYLDPVSFIPSE